MSSYQTLHGLHMVRGRAACRSHKDLICLLCKSIRTRNEPRAHFGISEELRDEFQGIQMQRKGNQD